jgi:molybdopterin converting factor small subunit
MRGKTKHQSKHNAKNDTLQHLKKRLPNEAEIPEINSRCTKFCRNNNRKKQRSENTARFPKLKELRNK